MNKINKKNDRKQLMYVYIHKYILHQNFNRCISMRACLMFLFPFSYGRIQKKLNALLQLSDS